VGFPQAASVSLPVLHHYPQVSASVASWQTLLLASVEAEALLVALRLAQEVELEKTLEQISVRTLVVRPAQSWKFPVPKILHLSLRTSKLISVAPLHHLKASAFGPSELRLLGCLQNPCQHGTST
jgi:hypothetical protein